MPPLRNTPCNSPRRLSLERRLPGTSDPVEGEVLVLSDTGYPVNRATATDRLSLIMTTNTLSDRTDFRDPLDVREYLSETTDSATAMEELIRDLRFGALCPFCLSPLRPSPACSTPADDAGVTWTEDGRRRFCDRKACGERANLDGPVPDRSRTKAELFGHFENALVALERFYHLEDSGFAVDVGAGEETIRQACHGGVGEEIETIAKALTAALSAP